MKDSDLANFFLLTRQFTKIPTDAVELFHLINDNEIKLVVFDSLRRFHGVDENSSEKMQPVLDAFARINIEAETSVVLIHHLSKQSGEKADKRPVFERMRGTSDLWAWRDCIIGIEGETGGTLTECSFQFRDAESPRPVMVKRNVHDVTGAVHLSVSAIEDSEEFTERAELILNYLRVHGPCSKDEACRKAGGRKAENVKVFDALVDKSMVAKSGFKWVVPELPGTGGNDGNE